MDVGRGRGTAFWTSFERLIAVGVARTVCCSHHAASWFSSGALRVPRMRFMPRP
jgi:hypothetical protein